MTCAYGPNIVVCYPTSTGLGEATDAWCANCRVVRRHWLQTTTDAWYDPSLFWRCDTCGRSRRTPMWRGDDPPLLWRHAVEITVAKVKREMETVGQV